jgi:hypothetical protein
MHTSNRDTAEKSVISHAQNTTALRLSVFLTGIHPVSGQMTGIVASPQRNQLPRSASNSSFSSSIITIDVPNHITGDCLLHQHGSENLKVAKFVAFNFSLLIGPIGIYILQRAVFLSFSFFLSFLYSKRLSSVLSRCHSVPPFLHSRLCHKLFLSVCAFLITEHFDRMFSTWKVPGLNLGPPMTNDEFNDFLIAYWQIK